MTALTVARINFEFTHRIDPDPRRKKRLSGGELRVRRTQTELRRLKAGRLANGSPRETVIDMYLANEDLIRRGKPWSIGAEVHLAAAERLRYDITQIRPYDMPWKKYRRLKRDLDNMRKRVNAAADRLAKGMVPWSESAARRKPWVPLGISESTYYRWKRDGKLPCQQSVQTPILQIDESAQITANDIPVQDAEGRSTTSNDGPMSIFSTSNEAAKINTSIEIPTETEPKPNHFRGEIMEQLRPDDLKDAISEKKFFCGNPVPITERARGMWSTILPALGIDPKFLTAKNGPCPMCGGKDRFRYTDLEGRGTWWCNGCDEENGRNGFGLALKFTGLPHTELSRRIAVIIDGAPPPQVRRDKPRSPNRDALNALWRRGRPIEPDDPVDRYLTGRGITIRDYPRCLRYVRQAKHQNGDIHPAMVAMICDAEGGRPAQLHKTYLTYEGQKAAVDRVRLFCPGTRPEGGAVRLAAHGAELGIAEGIETALAASQLHGVPVWAALDDGGVDRFIPPPEVTRLIIFGDNDANYAGQRAAFSLAKRAILVLKIKVEVRIPDRAGTDWNDVLRGVQP